MVCPFKAEIENGTMVCDSRGSPLSDDVKQCPTEIFNLCQDDSTDDLVSRKYLAEHSRIVSGLDGSGQEYDFTAVSTIVIGDAPAIDPIHAAGGCYCRECAQNFNLDYKGETYLICKVRHTNVSGDDFCSGGKLKSEQK